MKFCVSLLNSVQLKALRAPPWEKTITPDQQQRAVQLADELGYWKVSVPEHYIMPRESEENFGPHYLHTATALAFLAGATKRIKLSTGIAILPLVHPIAQAKIWATLDWLSGGRAVLTAGLGALKREYEMFGLNFHERGAMCDEHVQAIIELWTSDNPTFEGKYVQFRDVAFLPKPVQKPTIPFWFGGDSQAAMRRVARFGQGWSPTRTPPEKLREGMDFIRSHPAYDGRPIGLSYSMTGLVLADDHTERKDPPKDAFGASGLQETLDRVGRLQDLGVTETRLPPPPLADYEAYLDFLRWSAEEVFPHFPDAA